MKTAKTIKEYQECINEVFATKQPIKVIVEMTDEELEKRNELDMEGVEVLVSKKYDEIIPL